MRAVRPRGSDAPASRGAGADGALAPQAVRSRGRGARAGGAAAGAATPGRGPRRPRLAGAGGFPSRDSGHNAQSAPTAPIRSGGGAAIHVH